MNFAARAKLTHPGLEVEHRATLDGVEASDVDGEAIDAIDAADGLADPVGPIFCALRKKCRAEAHRAKADLCNSPKCSLLLRLISFLLATPAGAKRAAF